MSNTSEAFKNIELLRSYSGRRSKVHHWLQLAQEHLPQDIVLPEHIVPRAEVSCDVLVVECERCHLVTQVDSVAQAADFRDQHYHCGETHCDVWRCPTCDRWEFAFLTQCKYCDQARDVPVPTGTVTPQSVLDQYAMYDISVGLKWRASVYCNSLLRAKRAARAMYRGCKSTVSNLVGSWEVE